MHSYPLQQDEWVMCLREVQLRASEAAPLVHRLVVGTAFQHGEDNTCKGRLLLFEVEDGADEHRRLRLLFELEERGPVLTVATLKGMLLAGVGSKLTIWSCVDDALTPVGFHFVGFLIASVSVLNNYLLVADLHSGLHLLSWRFDKMVFMDLSQQPRANSAFACDFIVDGANLHLLSAEEGHRFRVFNYSKQSAESQGGALLLHRAAFHAGSSFTRLVRLQLPADAGTRPRHALLYGGLDGSMGFVMPLEESAYRRLYFLATRMVAGVPHAAGLNPRGFRAHKAGATSARELKGVVDGLLLQRFTALDTDSQKQLALQIGTTAQQLLESIGQLDRVTDLLF